MARYFLKPVFWNTNGYQSPTGASATSGYPKDNGYGHEEWNNSERLTFDEGGRRQHAFHSEPITGLSEEDDGQVFVFLYASHDGVQELVSAAGCATWLGDRPDERARLADILEIDQLVDETWAIEPVKRAHDNDKRHIPAWLAQ
jgi:predicted neuraminidase